MHNKQIVTEPSLKAQIVEQHFVRKYNATLESDEHTRRHAATQEEEEPEL